MRGVKVDPEFMSKFIAESIEDGNDSIDAIISRAKQQISNIDKKIIAVEKLKIERSKLNAMINSLDTENKKEKKSTSTLSLFGIKDYNLARIICSRVLEDGILVEGIFIKGYQRYEIFYCIKDLCRYNVLYMQEDIIFRGENYKKFLENVIGLKA